MDQPSDYVGFVGTAMIIGAYLLLQLKRLSSDGLSFSLLNGVGALLIIYSLIFKFNFPAFIVEVFWVGISIFGIVRCLRKDSASNQPEH